MPLLDLLPGIIWSGFLGLVIGNLATSPIYRLPRNEPLFVRDPFCDSCSAPLKTRDLFPVFSWLMTRGKCRYCGVAVPAAYTLMEAFTSLLFVLCYLKFGFTESFILVSLGMTAFFMLAAMLTLDDFFADRVLIAGLVCGMLYRTLFDHTLFSFAGTAYGGLIAGVIVWKLSGKPMSRNMAAFPDVLKLLVLAGVWLHWPHLIFLVSVAAMAAGLQVASCKLHKFKPATCNLQPTTPKKYLIENVIIAGAVVLVLLT